MILGTDDFKGFEKCIGASDAVHTNMRGHTGRRCLSSGEFLMNNIPSRSLTTPLRMSRRY